MVPKVGIVGTPDQISFLVPLLHSLGFQVTAIWCKNNEVCSKLSETLHVTLAAGSFQDLLLHPEVDLVYVATEPGMHAEVAVKALTSGKHCICQKPPATCQAEAEKMVSLSQYYNQLMSFLESHLRFLPAVTRMRELILLQYCGTPFVIEARVSMGLLIQSEAYSWKCDPSTGGGVLNMFGSHLIDLISFVSNQHAKRVHGTLKTFRPQTKKINGYRTITSDDFCCFQMQCMGGLSATVTLNTHAPGQFNFEFSVSGSNGRLVMKGLDLYGCKNGEQEQLIYKQEDVEMGAELGSKFSQGFYRPLVLGCRGMFQMVKSVLESVKSPTKRRTEHKDHRKVLIPSATFEDGVYIRTVLDAIHQSNSSGQWVDIPKANLVKSSNPFWTRSAGRIDEPSPKTVRPVFV